MNVIDKNYLSEYVRFLLHRTQNEREAIFESIMLRVLENMHEIKDILCASLMSYLLFLNVNYNS